MSGSEFTGDVLMQPFNDLAISEMIFKSAS